MIHLDTHAVEALGNKKAGWFGKDARRLLDRDPELRVSPMVLLELNYLWEIGRIQANAKEVLSRLGSDLGLRVCDLPFRDVALQASAESWTRDPFDRMIVAQARLAKAVLISRDSNILANYGKAIG